MDIKIDSPEHLQYEGSSVISALHHWKPTLEDQDHEERESS